MAGRVRWNVAALGVVLMIHTAVAQEQQPELTPAGRDVLRDGATKPAKTPQATCNFRGGLCGAVRSDGTVAVPPRYDWVGRFQDGRAAVRLGGLYGFVDEDGREIVAPKYNLVGDFWHGFAQVDVDGKSGLIDRDGRMVIAPKYGFISAIGPNRFMVSDRRWLGGNKGSEDFSGSRWSNGGSEWRMTRLMQPPSMSLRESKGVIDISGQWIEPPKAPDNSDKDNPAMRWVWKDNLWGLQRPDGSWVVEPRFEQADRLIHDLTRVVLNGKVGFIDRAGNLAVAPIYDKAWPFGYGSDRTAAVRDGVFGTIDKTGAWVSRAGELQIPFGITL
jgi:hypothetical protein